MDGVSRVLTDTRSPRPGAGKLYVVATPIGNLEDITVRALRVLSEVTLIACEDTRHTRKLLTHFQINTPQTSYYREKEAQKTGKIIRVLLDGRDVALVSDAGVPCISDPGFVLVNEALAEGICVVPIPGPCALTTAISMAGLKADQFLFGGFLPAKGSERRKVLHSLAIQPALLVFYESPHRLRASLADCLAVLGDRQAVVCKELTKIYEQCLCGSLSQMLASLEGDAARGEFVVLVEGAIVQEAPVEGQDLQGLLAWYHQQSGLSLKDSVAKIAVDLGLPRAKVYEEALQVWGK
ncbi:MAG: 16S rRNA (cytidine(1402)-2'-O)-methyltransferase [Desulfobulbaceae bacterium]|nr:16S rRNA (cytidine(1402)-2'-O)-methyltransferase [Desulfobulbaceae bacterium]